MVHIDTAGRRVGAGEGTERVLKSYANNQGRFTTGRPIRHVDGDQIAESPYTAWFQRHRRLYDR